MSFIHVLNYLSIFIIGAFCCYLANFSSSAKYSMTKAFIRGIFFLDFWYFRWFLKHNIYLWVNLLILLLVCTNLTLITQFSRNHIFQKPLFVFMVSPALWGCIFVVVAILASKYNRK